MKLTAIFSKFFQAGVSLSMLTLLLVAPNAFADTPDAPVILDFEIGGCSIADEICGDGIDQDCNGSDLLCPAPDQDRDGYSSSQDCDDTSRNIYPGISVACSDSCGQGTKTCQSNGSYSACSCTPLCEATGSGTCYYISKLTGSDSAAGTFSQPWKTAQNVVSYYNPSDRPSKWVQLQAGDVVYFMSGVYNRTYDYMYQGQKSIYLRGVHGTSSAPVVLKAYPGSHPVVAPFIAQGTTLNGIHIYQSDYIIVEGIEVTRTYGTPIHIQESSDITMRNLWVHHADGPGAHNISGIAVTAGESITIQNSLLHDVYDHSEQNYNSRLIAFFSGGNNKVLRNVLFQSPDRSAPSTGGCIVYKHVATVPNSTFEVGHNVLWNCAMTSIGSGTFNSHIHHNLLINSVAPQFINFGGGTLMRDNVVEYNTMIGKGLSYQPTTEYGSIGMLTFRNNIVVDNSSYTHLDGTITISTYGSQALYNDIVGGNKMSFNNNCYYSTITSPQFNLFSKSTSYGWYGGLSGWKSRGFDSGSIEANPGLNQYHIPTNAACQSYGWSAN
jgi:hypothetical protein